jgi:hypothetical protein
MSIPALYSAGAPIGQSWPALSWPALYWEYDVTADDDTDLPYMGRTFRCATTGGDVAVMQLDGSTMIHKSLEAGQQVNGLFKRLLATGTTATGIAIGY